MSHVDPVFGFQLDSFLRDPSESAKNKIIEDFESSPQSVRAVNFSTFLIFFEHLLNIGDFNKAWILRRGLLSALSNHIKDDMASLSIFVTFLHSISRSSIENPELHPLMVPILNELQLFIPESARSQGMRRDMHILWFELVTLHSFSPNWMSKEERESLSSVTLKMRSIYELKAVKACPYLADIVEIRSFIHVSENEERERLEAMIAQMMSSVEKCELKRMSLPQLYYTLSLTLFELFSAQQRYRLMPFKYFERCADPLMQSFYSLLALHIFDLFVANIQKTRQEKPEKIINVALKLIESLISPFEGIRTSAASFIFRMTDVCPGLLWSFPCCSHLFHLLSYVDDDDADYTFIATKKQTENAYIPKTLRKTIGKNLRIVIKTWMNKAFEISPADISSIIEKILLEKQILWAPVNKMNLHIMSLVPKKYISMLIANTIVKLRLVNPLEELGDRSSHLMNELAAKIISTPELNDVELDLLTQLPFREMKTNLMKSAVWSWKWCSTSSHHLLVSILGRLIIEFRKILEKEFIKLEEIKALAISCAFINERFQAEDLSINTLDPSFEQIASVLLSIVSKFGSKSEWLPVNILTLEWVLMLIIRGSSISLRPEFYLALLKRMSIEGPFTEVAVAYSEIVPSFSHLLELLRSDQEIIVVLPGNEEILQINILSQWAFAKGLCQFKQNGLSITQSVETIWPNFSGSQVAAFKYLWPKYPKELLRIGWLSGDISVKSLTASMILTNIEAVTDSYEAAFLLLMDNPNQTFEPERWKIKLPAEFALSIIIPPFAEQIVQFGIDSLSEASNDFLTKYVPQFVQCLRFDHGGQIAAFIVQKSSQSNEFAQLVQWNVLTEIQASKKGEFRQRLQFLSQTLNSQLSQEKKEFFASTAVLIRSILDVSNQLVETARILRSSVAVSLLSKIQVQRGTFLPVNPNIEIIRVIAEGSRPLPSHAKVPLLVNFETKSGGKIGCIFKTNDDVRQDILALQLIDKFQEIWKDAKLEIWMKYYKIVAVGPEDGIIEVIRNAKSRDDIGKETESSLFEYFQSKYGPPGSSAFHAAQYKFISSVAPYSIVSYLLSFKDRHNGNVMIDDEGHMIHVDFGFILDIAPGGNLKFEKAPFKLTREMVQIMGGSKQAEPFQAFEKLCILCFLAARERYNEIVALVSLMKESGLPCITGKTIKHLLKRFKLGISPDKAAEHCVRLVDSSYKASSTDIYDGFQAWQNGITF